MNPLAGNVTQCGIDHALALQPAGTGKCGAFDLHREVRFAAAVITGVAMVARRIVDHGKAAGGEGGGEQRFDFGFKWSNHGFPFSASLGMGKGVTHDRFHGRVNATGQDCDWPGCGQAGEFRAPGGRASGFDGPGDYRWLCLDHVRAFNAAYDAFRGMNAEEIWAAQSPISGWASETRAFSATAGIDGTPRWADFADPLDAISARARVKKPSQRQDGKLVTPDERRALDALSLPLDADRTALRQRYSELVRRYHPDRNGGDRNFEARLQGVVEAYQLLRRAAAFA